MLYSSSTMQGDLQELTGRENIPFEKLEGRTVFITGAGGMLAYYILSTLMYLNKKRDLNIHVIALARNSEKAKKQFEGFLPDPNFSLLLQDVSDSIRIEGPVDYIVHAAGASSPYAIKHDPVGIIRANTEGTRQVLELARHKKVHSLLYTSTREVYGEIKGKEWIKECDMGVLDPLDARSCYPESKRMAEQLLRSYYEMYRIPFQVVRIAHAYGPGMCIENDGRVMSDFIADVVHGRDILMKSDGLSERAFCYVTDAVAAMFLVMLNNVQGQAYNVANETETYTIRDVAQMLVGMAPKKDLKLVFTNDSEQSGYCQYKRIGLDTSKLRVLGWKPTVPLKEGLKRTLNCFNKEDFYYGYKNGLL